MKNIRVGILLLLFIIHSCSKTDEPITDDDAAIPPIVQHVEAEFVPFVDSFLEEMEARGLYLANKKLNVIFVDETTATGNGACGYGYSNFRGRGRARVEIMDTENCWHRRTDIEKENLMYHELGHALLAKGHFYEYFSNGSPKSLMCSNTCDNYRTYTKYQPEQRSYYLDQLRDPQQSTPEWANEKIFSNKLYSEDFDNSLDDWGSAILNDDTNSDRYTFFVDGDNSFSSPSSLAISSIANAESEAYGFWYKVFNVSDFDACANLKVRADIITKGLTEGNFFLVVDLYDSNDEFFTLFYNTINDAPGMSSHENFETDVICLPVETRKIRVRLYLDTKVEASVFIDNLEIELYE